MYRISDYEYSVIARSSRRVPAGMFAVSIKSNQGLLWSDAPVFFDDENQAEHFLDNWIGSGELRSSAEHLIDRMYDMIHEARLSSKDLESGFVTAETPYGRVKIQAWKRIEPAIPAPEPEEQPVARGLFHPLPVTEDITEAFEPWKADAWLAGARRENVARMNSENMMAYNNYLDNVAYQALRANDRHKAMQCLNLMRQIYIAAYNRGFNDTADRINQIVNHRRSEIATLDRNRELNGQPVRRGLFNPDPVEEGLNEEVEIHDTLNPAIWNENNTLKPEVAQKAKEVAQIFVDILTENGVKIKVMDIYLVGSNANYNYNESSDIDIHLIADPSLDCNDQHLKLIYDAYKTLFNRKYDISFKGINVEVYVETNTPSTSGGIYSIRNDKWIKEPDRNDIPEIDQEAVGQGLNEWTQRYEEITASPTIEEIEKYIDELYNLRINSIANEGEFGTGNLIFKEVRRNGILDDLKELKAELESKEMSLESLIEEVMHTTGKIVL